MRTLTRVAVAAAAAALLAVPARAQETQNSVQAAATEAALRLQVEQLEQQLAALKTPPTLAALRDKLAAQETAQQEQEARIEPLERKAALDRINFTGEIRIASDTLNGTQAPYFDGLKLQKGIVDSMFFMMTNQGAFPTPASADPSSIYAVLDNNVAAHYADYLLFTSRLTFADLKAAMAQFPAAQQAAMMQMLMPATLRAEQDYTNNILYTTRIRVNMKTDLAKGLSFSGRLAMYKAWGDSAGVQVFNGQPTSINIDGTTIGVPNSDIVRVDRAYFDWNQIGGTGLYLSVGRRPSTGGPPTEMREGRLRGGTPLGHVVDYQFDGVTVGYAFGDKMKNAIWRFCYGLGYESGFGSGDQLKAPGDRLKDVHFGGLNLDLYSTDTTFVQATVLRAMRVTDGFNSLVVMPVDPVTGNAAPGPAVMRFTPSSNIGDIDLAALAIERTEGPVKWFGSVAGMWSHPEDITTPFGGLLTDPFSVPESHDAWSVYTGLRYDFGQTQVGAEFNRGSRYWFNFTHAADEILLSKLQTRGNVYEVYVNQQIGKYGQLRVSGLQYDYEYSGSGWHLGAPKRLDETPMLGFPTYKDMFNLRVAFGVRF
ncbi:MAG: DUF3373 family protein [Acidobacteria bacterium]|nr:DUF3373 family protein [Acidobacteriota bacterium]